MFIKGTAPLCQWKGAHTGWKPDIWECHFSRPRAATCPRCCRCGGTTLCPWLLLGAEKVPNCCWCTWLKQKTQRGSARWARPAAADSAGVDSGHHSAWMCEQPSHCPHCPALPLDLWLWETLKKNAGRCSSWWCKDWNASWSWKPNSLPWAQSPTREVPQTSTRKLQLSLLQGCSVQGGGRGSSSSCTPLDWSAEVELSTHLFAACSESVIYFFILFPPGSSSARWLPAVARQGWRLRKRHILEEHSAGTGGLHQQRPHGGGQRTAVHRAYWLAPDRWFTALAKWQPELQSHHHRPTRTVFTPHLQEKLKVSMNILHVSLYSPKSKLLQYQGILSRDMREEKRSGKI